MGRDGERRTRATPPRPRLQGLGVETTDLESNRRDPGDLAFAVAPVSRRAGNRGVSIAAALVVVAIGIAIVKPWSQPVGDAPTAGPVAAATAARLPDATTSPTDDLSEGLAAPVCLGATGWRVASLETWRDQDVRVWRAVEPIADASGPLDPAIPTVPVVAIDVAGLGWCAPAYGPDRPLGPARIDAWFIANGTAQELGLRQVQPDHGMTPLAGLYVPLAPCELGRVCGRGETRAIRQDWESGRVVFRYEDGATGAMAWFGADVDLYSNPTPSGANLTAPTPVD